MTSLWRWKRDQLAFTAKEIEIEVLIFAQYHFEKFTWESRNTPWFFSSVLNCCTNYMLTGIYKRIVHITPGSINRSFVFSFAKFSVIICDEIHFYLWSIHSISH